MFWLDLFVLDLHINGGLPWPSAQLSQSEDIVEQNTTHVVALSDLYEIFVECAVAGILPLRMALTGTGCLHYCERLQVHRQHTSPLNDPASYRKDTQGF